MAKWQWMVRTVAAVGAFACMVVPAIVWGSPAGSAPPPAIVPRLMSNGETTDALSSVSCVNATTCFAVGASYVGPNAPIANPAKTFAGRWNGKSFSILPTPNPAGATNSVLVGVSCTSATNCFAVGYSGATENFAVGYALVERWNGKTWSIVAAAASVSGSGGWFTSVSCPTSTNCLAVGASVTFIESGYFHQTTLFEHWNGKTWALVASP